MVWCSHLLKSVPQSVMIPHKGFSVVDETELDVFLEFPCFLYDSTNVVYLVSLVPLPFLNLAWKSASSWFA